jgi:signal peptidase II
MPAGRTFRWLFLAVALAGLGLDLGTKYVVFRWLYNGGEEARRGAFEARVVVRGNPMDSPTLHRCGRYDLVPGWFCFIAEHTAEPIPESSIAPLQNYSAPVMPHVNFGALFGLGGNHQGRANLSFAVVSIVAAIAITVWGLRRANAEDPWMCVCLGFILAGTLGNFYDRLFFGGVRDFLYFYKVEWPVFNVADCGLVAGAAMLFIQAFFLNKKTKTPAVKVG